MTAGETSRFDRLKAYSDQDPTNLGLIAAAVEAALAEGRFETVSDLVDRHAAVAAPPPSLINALGLAALAEGRAADAEAIFASLIGQHGSDPALRFNLASAKAMSGDHAAAAELLDPETASRVPAAGPLKVRSLLHEGRPEDALAAGEALVEAGAPPEPDLAAVLALAALDCEALDKAETYAQAAGPDGLGVQGLVALSRGRLDEAAASLDAALTRRPQDGRALIGAGLLRLNRGDYRGAADHLDRAARLFEDHPGSWIGAGWAHLLAGDPATARARFQTALTLNPALPEGLGGLAVLDLAQGETDAARHGAEAALRLDRNALGAALTKEALLRSDGKEAQADRLRRAALQAQIGPEGETLEQAITRFQPKA